MKAYMAKMSCIIELLLCKLSAKATTDPIVTWVYNCATSVHQPISAGKGLRGQNVMHHWTSAAWIQLDHWFVTVCSNQSLCYHVTILLSGHCMYVCLYTGSLPRLFYFDFLLCTTAWEDLVSRAWSDGVYQTDVKGGGLAWARSANS